MKINISRFDYYSSYLYKAVDIYCAVWNRNPEDSTTFFKRYARMHDFIGYVALVQEQVVGMAFGTASQAGQWWHDRVARHVGKHHTALTDAWVLTELAVLKPYRKHKIGSLLHDQVLSQQPFPNVLLSTQVDNHNARHFYEKRQWMYLHDGFAFHQGRPEYCIMHKVIDHEA